MFKIVFAQSIFNPCPDLRLYSCFNVSQLYSICTRATLASFWPITMVEHCSSEVLLTIYRFHSSE
ncbi:hypothetical protein CW304_12570 [Bacillus sp. UFRGS-B20]|nr:hypothetical protein CW304_12570 [Bacillus sp. UFRGS-B20]